MAQIFCAGEANTMTEEVSRLLLHIGGQKCGSSAIQGYLFFGRFRLEEHNVVYLDNDLGSVVEKAGSHTSLLPRLLKEGRSWVAERVSGLNWADPARSYVLSTEGFCQIENSRKYAEALSPFHDHGRVEILFYVRPQTEILYSGWQQWGLDYDFDCWVDRALDRNFADWNTIHRNWRAHFPNAEFQVRLFSRENFHKQDILEDLLFAANLPRVKLGKVKEANPTYDDLTALAIQEIARDRRISASKLCVSMKKSGLQIPGERKNHVMSDETADRIHLRYAEANREFLDAIKADDAMRTKFEFITPSNRTPPSENDVQAQKYLVMQRIAEHLVDY